MGRRNQLPAGWQEIAYLALPRHVQQNRLSGVGFSLRGNVNRADGHLHNPGDGPPGAPDTTPRIWVFHN